jgi:hypothetical protein
MSKEKVLGLLQGLVLGIVQDDLANDAESRRKWIERKTEFDKEIAKLNSCDSLWLNDEYAKWLRTNKVFQEHLDELQKNPHYEALMG